jgi:multisubunit Na+/H+ antiporter MnhG subunit
MRFTDLAVIVAAVILCGVDISTSDMIVAGQATGIALFLILIAPIYHFFLNRQKRTDD